MPFAGLRKLVLFVVGTITFLSVGVGAALAKPRSGSATDPVEGLAASRDLVRVIASYDPANGNLRARVRFSRPITPGTMVQLWFRADRSRACRGSVRDIRFHARTAKGLPSFEVLRERPEGFSEGVRKVSRDGRELILSFGTPAVAKLDLRCVYAVTRQDTARGGTVYDKLNAPVYLR